MVQDDEDAMCMPDHFPFTFHTHPVLVKEGRLVNHAMIPSNTDLTGQLETSVLHHAWQQEGEEPLAWPESPTWKAPPCHHTGVMSPYCPHR